MLAVEHGDKRIRSSFGRGFTMLEVMVAFTILAVGVLAVAPVTIFMIQTNIHNKHFTQARMFAEQYSERLRTLDYENTLLADDGDTTDAADITNPDHSDTLQVENRQYIVMWNIKEATSPVGIKEISIIVSWIDPGTGRRRQCSTLAFKASVSR